MCSEFPYEFIIQCDFMSIRQESEKYEKEILSPYASLSMNSSGRDRFELPCDIRTDYQRDRDRILHCKSFRRLKHKTQVFLSPEKDHYRTRLTHTLEVSQIARTISRALRLNEDLTEAIALGHDLGHTPFGHAGEAALNSICSLGFEHYKQSLRIVEFLEKGGLGLNLTKEVRDGILNHRTSGSPSTLEGKVVRLSDKIAYINHDIDDSIRAKIFKEEDIPGEYSDILGHSVRERLDTIIHDVIYNSMNKADIQMSERGYNALMGLRKWMFKTVYRNDIPKAQEYRAKDMLCKLYEYYMENIQLLPKEYHVFINDLGQETERVVCDYIAGMTDNYAIDSFIEIFIPKSWKG